MAFEGLSEKLTSAFKKLRSKGKLSEKDVRDSMREVRLALLEADVNYKVAKDFTDKVAERAIGEEVMQSLTPAQMVVKIVNEELVNLMGESQSRLNIASSPPTVIMMCGLQGSGKTTHSGKLALAQKKKGHRPLLVACDVYRQLNSYKWWRLRLVYRFLKWDRKIQLKSQKKLFNTQKITVTTL